MLKAINYGMSRVALYGIAALGFGLLFESEVIKNTILFFGIFDYSTRYYSLDNFLLALQREVLNEKNKETFEDNH